MSDEAIIRVENLGKRYSIHHQRDQRYVALRDVIAEKAKRLFRRQSAKRRGNGAGDPTSELGPLTSGRTSDLRLPTSGLSVSDAPPAREDFWALKGVSFEVRRGEVLGIIGRNGAGKSTLLKILSRITEPTEGRVRIRGRVASLLEVGTGFHPELTGRENIYLNGAILGMSKAEIKKKFDEIVAFAETEKFLDTPVKRYSSGMYVRLAFAVAAHLEPEILIVDEVLAVGDSDFQKKCLGKMQQVAEGLGRTVLFVSHNMAAITALTSNAMLLTGGRLVQFGNTDDVVKAYNDTLQSVGRMAVFSGRGKHTRIIAVKVFDEDGLESNSYKPGCRLKFAVDFETDGTPGLSLELVLLDPDGRRLGLFTLHQFFGQNLPTVKGVYRCELLVAPLWLAAGTYFFDVTTSIPNVCWDHYVERASELNIPFSNPEGRAWDFRHQFGFGSLVLRSDSEPKITRLEKAVF
jgi:lipopolysaccharide transport system ATP-binding protein